jgi:hypothetical protein
MRILSWAKGGVDRQQSENHENKVCMEQLSDLKSIIIRVVHAEFHVKETWNNRIEWWWYEHALYNSYLITYNI